MNNVDAFALLSQHSSPSPHALACDRLTGQVSELVGASWIPARNWHFRFWRVVVIVFLFSLACPDLFSLVNRILPVLIRQLSVIWMSVSFSRLIRPALFSFRLKANT
ncbi:hypothetical protein V6N13_044419 [Hibiscus sabdariffa]|uniref:Uncharacterized protein n=1 Tax=Hibiscus sabdariffa TaxID=183260 RepID=A0ABR2RIF5_9ROSI